MDYLEVEDRCRFFETEFSKNILFKLNYQNSYIASVLVNKYKDLKINYVRNGKIISNIISIYKYESSRIDYLAEVVNVMEIKYLEEHANEKSNISRVWTTVCSY